MVPPYPGTSMMAGHPLLGGWPEGTVYQARMVRPSKLDILT